MANKTCLRKCIRSFLRHRHFSAAAERRLCISPPMDKLLHHQHQQQQQHHHRHGFACLQEPSPSSTPLCSYASMRAHAAKRSSSHCLQLIPDLAAPLQPACFPLLPPSSSCSFIADEAELDLLGGYADESFDAQSPADHHLQRVRDDCCKLLSARSHSCSKLQYSRVPSIKSLLCRTHSQGRLPGLNGYDRSSFISLHTNDEASGSPHGEGATRAPSSSLRHLKKANGQGCSFHGELAEGSSCRKGKRAPKGHVAVYVDGGKERVVVPIPYLSHPCFEELLRRAESEYGYAQKGGLLLPCSISELHDTLNCIRRQRHHSYNQSEGHHNHDQSESHRF